MLWLVVLGAVVVVRYRALVPGLPHLLRLPVESTFALQPAPAYARLAAGHIDLCNIPVPVR